MVLKRSTGYWIGGTLVGLVGLYAVAGYYVLPYWARTRLPEIVHQATGAQFGIETVAFDPFEWRAQLRGIRLTGADGKDLLGLESLVLDIQAMESLGMRGLAVTAIEFGKPTINLERRADGRLNLADLRPAEAEPDPSSEPAKEDSPPPLLIHRLAIDAGEIRWRDALAGEDAAETLMPLQLEVAELGTVNGKNGASGRLAVGLASGGTLNWQGQLTLMPLVSTGSLRLEGIVVPKLLKLAPKDVLPVTIDAGQLSVTADYHLSQHDGGVNLALNNGVIDLKKWAISEPAQHRSLLDLPSLTLSGVAVDLQDRQLTIAKVAADDAAIQVWLQADGVVNYQALFAEPGQSSANASNPAAAPPTPAEPAKPWRLKVDDVALSNHRIEFTDYSLTKPVTLELTELALAVRGFDSANPGKLPLTFATRINQKASLKLAGDTVLQPFGAAWQVTLDNLLIKPFQAYLDPYLNLELVDGAVNLDGNLQLTTTDQFQLTFTGNANIDNLVTRDQIKNKDFLKWSDLTLAGIDIDLNQQDFKIDRVVFERPYFRFNIKKDGTTNVDELSVVKPPAQQTGSKVAEAPTKPDVKSPEPKLVIGKIEMKNGRSDFADYSLILPFVAEMKHLNGEVSGFSTEKDAYAQLDLQGKVYDLASVDIKGKYQFQTGNTDVGLKFTHMPLPLITPYMAEFAGYKIEKGQMALDLQYKISKGQLEVQNKLFIDQLALGDHVENPKAMSLPLHLAIALLKDADGRINLDFPISGSLEDPKFSLGALVSDVLVNLIAKAVASPFKMFGALLGEDKDYSVVKFGPGSAKLAAEESAKLDQLGQALTTKPELTLEIKGKAYETQDWPAMRYDAVKDVLKKMKSGELRDQGQKIRHEYLELSDDEYRRLLAKFFGEVFPEELDRSLFGKPRLKSDPNADFYSVAQQRLEGIFHPDPQRLTELAVDRANHIAQYVTMQGKVERGRVYILAPELSQAETADGLNSVLSLGALP
ncbi:DUF748 domain-containing protein [Methylococcaceae bacterium WWC4]|nr:DUF748 domain-containing protein [Methylococcaceae bacterium WWC4]